MPFLSNKLHFNNPDLLSISLVEKASTGVTRYPLLWHSHLILCRKIFGIFGQSLQLDSTKHIYVNLSHLLKGEEKVIRNLLVPFDTRFGCVAEVLTTGAVPWKDLGNTFESL